MRGQIVSVGLAALVIAAGPVLASPLSVSAHIGCDDFSYHDDAQAIVTALTGDPFDLDGTGGFGYQDNGVACDQHEALPAAPLISMDSPKTDLPTLPSDYTPLTVSSIFGVTWIAPKDGDNVTMIGIAAPDQRDECFHDEVKAYLDQIMPRGTTVYLEKESLDRDDQSAINAVWRDLWIKQSDGTYELLNVKLVRDGYAVAAPRDPNLKYAVPLRAAQEQAITEGMGLWGSCAR